MLSPLSRPPLDKLLEISYRGYPEDEPSVLVGDDGKFLLPLTLRLAATEKLFKLF